MKTLFKRFLVLPLGIFSFIAVQGQTDVKNSLCIDSSIYNRLPFQMEEVQQPSFPDYAVSITEFGAKGDGVTLNTEPINKAIKQVNEKGGGKVIIPEGLWLTGPIVLLSNVNLYSETNALVIFTEDHTQYPIIKTSFEGLETHRCQSPISAFDQTNIAITGKGIFDGNGDTWRPVKKDKLTASQWKKLIASGGVVNKAGNIWLPSKGALKGMEATTEFNVPNNIKTEADWESIRDFLRPVLLNTVRCKTVLVEGVTFRNSPGWCIHPLSCKDITFNKVTVSNPWYAQNGDALDMESCKNALIINNSFDAGDDAICLKSGKDEEGRRRGEPTENVIVMNNIVLHGHGGFVVGSEMSGGVKNIYVDNNTFIGTDVGLRFKSTRGRGGVVENIYIKNINMINIAAEGILFDLFYGGQSPTEVTEQDTKQTAKVTVPPVNEGTPSFRNIYIDNIACKGAGRAIFFNGLPEMRIKNINLNDVVISDAKNGAKFSQAEDINLKNIRIKTLKAGNNTEIVNVKNVTIDGKKYNEIDSKGIKLNL